MWSISFLSNRKTIDMHVYHIKFRTPEGTYETEEVDGCDPGNAFAKCQKAHPGAVMLMGTRQHRIKKWRITYEPPPIQRDAEKQPRPARPPKRTERDGIMPFYDEAQSLKP